MISRATASQLASAAFRALRTGRALGLSVLALVSASQIRAALAR